MKEVITKVGMVCAYIAIVFGSTHVSADPYVQAIQDYDIDQGTLSSVLTTIGQPVCASWAGVDVQLSQASTTQNYCLHYENGFSIRMNYSSVMELRISSANLGYKWQNVIQIGSSMEEVFAEAGYPDVIVTDQPNGGMSGVFYQNIDGRLGQGYYYRSDLNVRFFFDNERVCSIFLTRSDLDSYFDAMSPSSLPAYSTVSWLNLSEIPNLTHDLVQTTTFNTNTLWAEGQSELAADLLETAKNPGLGVRRLHARGFTGQGVTVGMIGEALVEDHEEYAGKIVEYYNPLYVRPHNDKGAANLSVMIGEAIGTAPHANVYYAVCRDGVYEVDYAKSLYWMIRKNESLPDSQKIRVVAVAAAPGEEGVLMSDTAYFNWQTACQAAEKAGMLVLDTTSKRRIFDACWYDMNEPDRLELCTPGYPDIDGQYNENKIMVPTSQRTVAQQYASEDSLYMYTGRHGIGWTTPYAAGILALGWQCEPNKPADELVGILKDTAYAHADWVHIIHPQRFVYEVAQCPAAYYVDQTAVGLNDGSSWADAFTDIQNALAVTIYGDTICVAEGVYVPDQGSGDSNASFVMQKGVTLVGGYPTGGGQANPGVYTTVLSGDLLGNDTNEPTTQQDNSRHVVLGSYTDEQTVLQGMTVSGGQCLDDMGAGLFAEQGELIINQCVFQDNHAYQGGALGFRLSDATVQSTRFVGNSALDLGGAVINDEHSSPLFTHCIFTQNSADKGGVMVNCDYACDPVLEFCTVACNAAVTQCGGLYSWAGAPTITNCILWGNEDAQGFKEAAQMMHDAYSRPWINYCCVQGWSGLWKGIGNFSDDPLFVNPGTVDFHLKSTAGYWDCQTQQWTESLETSSCINAGNPEAGNSNEPDSSRVNLGAYGNTAQASKSN